MKPKTGLYILAVVYIISTLILYHSFSEANAQFKINTFLACAIIMAYPFGIGFYIMFSLQPNLDRNLK